MSQITNDGLTRSMAHAL